MNGRKKREYFSILNESAAKQCRSYKYTGRAVKKRLKKVHNSSCTAADEVVHW